MTINELTQHNQNQIAQSTTLEIPISTLTNSTIRMHGGLYKHVLTVRGSDVLVGVPIKINKCIYGLYCEVLCK